MASHRCAAFLWKFRKFERPVVEVLVVSGHAPTLAGMQVRRTGRLDPSERTHIGPIPLTSRARTLLDLVSVTESELEDDLLALIRRFGLPEPEPQHPYRGRRIDFAYPELLFGIEANSVQAHAAKEDVQRNAEKARGAADRRHDVPAQADAR